MKLDNLPTKPGFYLVEGRLGMFFAEVDENMVMHQLKPETFERDGALSDDGWLNPVEFFGPLPVQRVDS